MSEVKYYVLCKDNCEFEAMSKEQILTAIQQAVSTGEIKDVDTGFVTKIKELNSGAALSFWVGTNAEYIEQKDKLAKNTFVIISDDTSKDVLLGAINGILDGTTSVPNAANANKVQNVDFSDDTPAAFGDYVVPKKKLIFNGSASGGIVTTGDLYVAGMNLSGKMIAGKHYEVHGSVLDNYFRMEFTMQDTSYVGDSEIRLVRLYATDSYPKNYGMRITEVAAALRFMIFDMCGNGVAADTSNSKNTITITKVYEIVE